MANIWRTNGTAVPSTAMYASATHAGVVMWKEGRQSPTGDALIVILSIPWTLSGGGVLAQSAWSTAGESWVAITAAAKKNELPMKATHVSAGPEYPRLKRGLHAIR